MVFRHEWKHEINVSDMITLRHRLQAVMQPDEHAVNGKYEIRSLYFDNLEDKALREKLDGVNIREKFRMRYYNKDASLIHLEKKSKRGNLGTKESTLLTTEEAQAIADGCYDWMGRHENSLVQELYRKITIQGLRPKTIVDYTREPYIYAPGNVRVTIDYNIRSGLFIFSIYKKTFSGVMYSSSFAVTLVALTMITTLVILAVTSNVVLSLGMVGALSIVRFRTAIKEPLDIAFLFWSIAVGIVLAVGLIPLAVIGSILIGIFLLVFVNQKSHANPYIVVISCTDHESETRAKAFLEEQVKRVAVKSKTAPCWSAIMVTIWDKGGMPCQRVSTLTGFVQGRLSVY